MTIHLERVPLDAAPWDRLDEAPDRTISQTLAWLDFLVETQGAEPVVARVLDGATTVGWFTGAVVRRGPLKVLGSPMRGWTTAAMGFNLEPGVDRSAALAALVPFAFRGLGCVHLEYADRALLSDDEVPSGFRIAHLPGYELALVDRSSAPLGDEDLLAGMKPYGRRDVRRAVRNGIEIESVDPLTPGTFVDEYYEQVTEAFAKRGFTPTFPAARVQSLVHHLGPTGRLVLLRARTPDGRPVATGIFPGMVGGTAEFWAGASHRADQHLLPNEALMWTALRTWRDRGAVRMNFGGGGGYKAKYGGEPHVMPWVRRSRFGALEHARHAAMRLDRRRRSFARRG